MLSAFLMFYFVANITSKWTSLFLSSAFLIIYNYFADETGLFDEYSSAFLSICYVFFLAFTNGYAYKKIINSFLLFYSVCGCCDFVYIVYNCDIELFITILFSIRWGFDYLTII